MMVRDETHLRNITIEELVLSIYQQMLEIGIAQRVNGTVLIEFIVIQLIFITFLLKELLALDVV
jgi:hypothetical protein